jgi:hypothetical protein
MYRKEECLSLLKDPEQHEDDENPYDTGRIPTFKWHKVIIYHEIVTFICLIVKLRHQELW